MKSKYLIVLGLVASSLAGPLGAVDSPVPPDKDVVVPAPVPGEPMPVPNEPNTSGTVQGGSDTGVMQEPGTSGTVQGPGNVVQNPGQVVVPPSG